MLALPAPTGTAALTQWTFQPVALVVAGVALAWYLRGTRQVAGWSRLRTVSFLGAVVLFAWTTNGFPSAYGRSLFWVWSIQTLLLLLVVPVVLMAGQPVELARLTHGESSALLRFTRSAAGRFFGNPLVGPALIPALSVVLFFGPLPGWAVEYPVLAWVVQIATVTAGALIALPLVAVSDDRGSMAVGLALTVGVFELLLDAVPGIVLRLHTTLVTSYFDHRLAHSWTPSALRDQQIGGALLWTVAEVIDLPFLAIVYARWVKADARDAQTIDTVLDAERIARGQQVEVDEPVSDTPWWLTDPEMRKRLR